MKKIPRKKNIIIVGSTVLIIALLIQVMAIKYNNGLASLNGTSGEVGGLHKVTGLVYVERETEDFNQMDVLTKSAEELGIDIEFIMTDGNTRNSVIQTLNEQEEMPHFIMNMGISDAEAAMLQNMEIIIPLNDLIDENAPNLKALLEEEGRIRHAIVDRNGMIYTLPEFDTQPRAEVNEYMFINKTWLDRLGLEVPTTVDAFYDVLNAFKVKDPNGNGKDDEIPLSFVSNRCEKGEEFLLGSWGVIDSQSHLMVKDGDVIFVPEEEGYKEGMKYLAKLYQEGLLDTEVFTQSKAVYRSKGKAEETILGVFTSYLLEEVVGGNPKDEYIPLPPLKGPSGEQMWGSRGGNPLQRHKFMITSSNPHPELTMQWVDQFFDPEKAMRMFWGYEEIMEQDESGKYVFKGIDEQGELDVKALMKASPGPYTPGIRGPEYYEQLELQHLYDGFEESYRAYEPYLHREEICEAANPMIMSNVELIEIQKEIDRYVREVKIRWISGERDIDKEWENYKGTLKNLGLEQYKQVYEESQSKCLKATGSHQ